MSPKVEMIASICSASTRSSGRWSLISEYVRKPRSLPSLIRFFRRVRRVSASSLGSSGGISQASFLPLRPGRPLTFDFAAATLASSSSSAALALLIPVLPAALPFFSSGLAADLPAGSLAGATGFFARTFFTGFLAALLFFAAGCFLGAAFFFKTLFLSGFFLALETREDFDLRLSLAILAS